MMGGERCDGGRKLWGGKEITEILWKEGGIMDGGRYGGGMDI